MAIEKVRAFFRAKGLEDRIREFDVSSATVELAAQAVGCEPARIGKTLSFLHEDGALLIVCAGDAKIDNSKFKGQFHHKATMLHLSGYLTAALHHCLSCGRKRQLRRRALPV